ncbi:MAG: DHH family phosphoesterase [Blautia sp.]|nr:DHH family phosphoesterase [Lachnoclostridium sp.]MCM1211202.1 DHH family phosphoesterase [Blautia sp.]
MIMFESTIKRSEVSGMKLSDLNPYNPIMIQCHDNPDADAIASGYALYTYFRQLGKDVRLVYLGRSRIQKSNLCLMLEHLEISVEYIERPEDLLRDMPQGRLEGLLLTVDCQYGAGNVTRIPAQNVAIIDHHQIENHSVVLSEINPGLGSCSTLVWKMLREEGFEVKDTKLGTALYYGLYTDTNQFAEIFNPLDMDMREALPCEKTLIQLFRNSNLSLDELEIAGVALIRHIYNDDYHYAIIKSQPCDPNILGLISDFLLQVAEVYVCVVYNEWKDGYKFSVRSCVKEVQANELAAFLAEGIGSGGGHHEKAGGFISKTLYEEVYPTLHSEAFFSERLNDYFDNCQIIVAKEYEIDISDMQSYVKKKMPLGFVRATDVLPNGTPITIRTLEGDVDMVVEPDLIIMIGIKGEVYPNRISKFEKTYELTEEPYCAADCVIKTEYQPTIHNRDDGTVLHLADYAKICIASGGTHIHAKELTTRVKVFTAWDEEKYMLGKPGDYLVVRCDDRHDIYVVERDIFFKTYDRKDAD